MRRDIFHHSPSLQPDHHLLIPPPTDYLTYTLSSSPKTSTPIVFQRYQVSAYLPLWEFTPAAAAAAGSYPFSHTPEETRLKALHFVREVVLLHTYAYAHAFPSIYDETLQKLSHSLSVNTTTTPPVLPSPEAFFCYRERQSWHFLLLAIYFWRKAYLKHTSYLKVLIHLPTYLRTVSGMEEGREGKG